MSVAQYQQMLVCTGQTTTATFPSSVASAPNLNTPTQQGGFDSGGARNLLLFIKGASGAGSVDVVIQGYDPGSQSWYTILDSGAVSGTTLKKLTVSPHIAAAANSVAQDVVPANFRIVATVTGTFNFSIGMSLTT